MRIFVSGLRGGERFKQTHGEAELLRASDNGVIEHIGDTKKAMALDAGSITVSGNITEIANASDNGDIFGYGDTEKVRAARFGSVTLAGNPVMVEATDNGRVIVFGEPKRINTRHSGHVTVVALDSQYEPDTLSASDNGSLRVITPGAQDAHETSQYLNYYIDKLFPDGQVNPLFVAYTGLLQHNSDRYVAM